MDSMINCNTPQNTLALANSIINTIELDQYTELMKYMLNIEKELNEPLPEYLRQQEDHELKAFVCNSRQKIIFDLNGDDVFTIIETNNDDVRPSVPVHNNEHVDIIQNEAINVDDNSYNIIDVIEHNINTSHDDIQHIDNNTIIENINDTSNIIGDDNHIQTNYYCIHIYLYLYLQLYLQF